MKLVPRAVLFPLIIILLTVPAFADMGPKPQLVVRVENAPEELYYLDLVREGNDNRPGTENHVEWNYTEEEFAALDQEILETMVNAVPEGWFACIVQKAAFPMWGKLTGEDGIHEFGYGLPETCRILMASKSGEVFLSEPFTREALQSSVTVDWAAKTLKVPPVSLNYAAQFLATFLPTLAIEGALLLLFRLWSKRNGLVFLLANLVTQGGLNLWASVRTVRYGPLWIEMVSHFFNRFIHTDNLRYEFSTLPRLFSQFPVYWIIPAEAVILLVEMGLYIWLFQGKGSKKRAVPYALTANLCSFVLGLCLAEPVWKFVVNTIL